MNKEQTAKYKDSSKFDYLREDCVIMLRNKETKEKLNVGSDLYLRLSVDINQSLRKLGFKPEKYEFVGFRLSFEEHRFKVTKRDLALDFKMRQERLN